MDHNIPLITTIAAGFGMALILGFIAERVKVPALVGYLGANILIGPATPGFVADVPIASQLSEIGVMLLMLGVGLHFSLNDLLAVKRIAIPGALVQMSLAATLLGRGLGWWWAERRLRKAYTAVAHHKPNAFGRVSLDRLDVDRGPPGPALNVLAGNAYRFARTVHLGRGGIGHRHCLRPCGTVQRVFCNILQRFDTLQPASPAAATSHA